MRRGADAAALVLASVVWAAASPGRGQAPVPEDLDAAVAELADLDQPPTAQEVADLLADGAAASGTRSWGTDLLLRWQRDGAGRMGRDATVTAGGRAWDLRLRSRETVGAGRLAAGTGAAALGPLRVRVGGWTWQQGFGLLVGRAGRGSALAADGGLAPGPPGPRGWTGWPDARAARGAVLGWQAGAWVVEAAGGHRGDDGARSLLAAVGRRSGTWRLAAAGGGRGHPAVGICGRWSSGPWAGTWECAQRPGALPAGAVQIRWRDGPRFTGEVAFLGVPRGGAGPPAADLPLLGADPGTAWALRGRWRPLPGANLATLVARADRDDRLQAAPESRLVSDILGQAALPNGLALAVRLRTTSRVVQSWSAEWPWAPPEPTPGRRTQALTVTLDGRRAGTAWRLGVRSLAVDHSATAGRRSLVTAELRRDGTAVLSWRLAWRLAWGAPVDLADAVGPLPGLVVPRHWGAWAGGWFGRAGVAKGPWRLDAAADLRTAGDGRRDLEVWCGAGAAW